MSEDTGMDPIGLERLNRLGGAAFVGQMIDLFLEEAQERLSAARQGEEAADLRRVGDAAHSIKSSAQNFGAERLSRIAETIELRTRAGDGENLAGLVDEMEEAYRRARLWLERERAALKL